MGILDLLLIALMGALVLIGIAIFGKTRPRKRGLNQQYYQERWQRLLVQVKSPEGMALAVIDADKLLDDALKKRRFKGNTMGERLVTAQHSLSDNDAVWYAHKLRNRLVHETNIKLKKREAQTALAGFKIGLKDLGAL